MNQKLKTCDKETGKYFAMFTPQMAKEGFPEGSWDFLRYRKVVVAPPSLNDQKEAFNFVAGIAETIIEMCKSNKNLAQIEKWVDSHEINI